MMSTLDVGEIVVLIGQIIAKVRIYFKEKHQKNKVTILCDLIL